MTSGESNPKLYDFRKNLLKVSQSLSDEEVKDLAYICPEIKSTEGISKGCDLFLELEKKGLISPGNYDYLLDRLLQIAREKLATTLIECILPSPWTAHDTNVMLDRLMNTGRDDVALHFMQWLCRSRLPGTPSACTLMEYLIKGGRDDLAMRLMVRLSCLHLPRQLQSEQQVMQVVYHAKLTKCASHKTVLSILCDPTSPLRREVISILTKHYQEVKQSADVNPDAIYIQWPELPLHKSSGTVGNILNTTLESTFSFADKYHKMITAITEEESIILERMEISATSCNSAMDDFNTAHASTQWNLGEREEVLGLRNVRRYPGVIHIQTAVKSICNICEGILCGKAIGETEATVSHRLFTLETVMYTTWCAIPMYHWMRTIIQLAASSRLDLTKYKDAIIKVATDHREPIVQYHDELSKIIGQDAMRNIDSILQIHQQEISKPNSEIASTTTSILGRYMAVYWYAYLLQLLVLACCGCSTNPLEMAAKMSKFHCRFHENNIKEVLQCGMEITRKVFIAIHTEIERFKSTLIQQCPEPSAERALLNGLLQPVNFSMECQK